MKRFVLLIAVIFLAMQSPSRAYQLLSPDTLSKWMTSGPPFDFLLIDVRETSEMDSIIATETCRPYHLAWTSHVFDSSVTKLPNNKAIVLHCRSGVRSGLASQVLDAAGFSSVYSLAGGFLAWKGPTKPFSYVKPITDLPAPSMTSSSATISPSPSLTAGKFFFRVEQGRIYCNALAPGIHSLAVFDGLGKCMLAIQNPFAARKDFVLPSGLVAGQYVVRMSRGGDTQTDSFLFTVK